MTWKYEVTNNSNADLVNVAVNDSDPSLTVDCGDGTNIIAVLAIGATVTCQATGTAIDGAYSNNADTSGTPAVEDPANPGTFLPTGHPAVTNDDPSHYTGGAPGIDLEKFTNGVQSDEAPGESILDGSPITWTYVITNTGTTPLIDVIVSDDQGVAVDCGDGTNEIAALAVGGSVTCTGTGTAGASPYTNVGSVSGTPAYEDPANPGSFLPLPGAAPVGDNDSSNYDGVPQSFDLALRKSLDPATADGPDYIYNIELLNQGNVEASDVTIVDYLPEGMTSEDPNWTHNSDGTATTVVPGPVLAGETIIVSIVVQITGFGDFVNTAGIDSATPVHPITGAPLDLTDVDSTPGDPTDDPLVDDVIDGTDGDEDDSDVAMISLRPPGPAIGTRPPLPVAPSVPATPVETVTTTVTEEELPQALALTGAEVTQLALVGFALLAAGALFVTGSQRRKNRDG